MKRFVKSFTEQNLLWWWGTIGCLAWLGQLARIETPVGKVSGYELVLVAWVIWVVWRYPVRWRTLWQQPSALAVVGWLGWLVVSLGLNAVASGSMQGLVFGSAYLGRLTLYILAGWLLSQQRWSAAQKQWWQTGVSVWFGGFALLGLLQYLLVPDTRWLYWLGWDDHLDRAFGTLLDPGFFGIIMVLGALWGLYHWVRATTPQHQVALSGLMSLCITALVLSTSRAAYLAWGVALVWWSVRQRVWTGIAIIFLTAVLIVWLPRDGGGEGQKLLRTASVEARTDFTQARLQSMATWQYVVGKGWYSVASQGLTGINNELSHATTLDSTWLHVWYSAGIIGFVWWIALLGWWWRSTGQSVLELWLIAILTHGFFAPTLWYSWILLALLWLAPYQNEKISKK